MEDGDRGCGDGEVSSREPNLALGVSLLAVAVLAVWMGFGIAVPRNASVFDPGPRAFPLLLAIVIGIGGLVEIGRSVVAGRSDRRLVDDLRAWKRSCVGGAIVIGYVVCITPVGFILATVVFGTALLIYLGQTWWRAALAAVVLALVVHLSFGKLFLVDPPRGILDGWGW